MDEKETFSANVNKERQYYLDFVRAIATIAIVITHYNALYLYMENPMPEKGVITSYVSNVYIGSWGVSLFLIISGAALMYVYEEKLKVSDFYRKRFFSIYPMFWMMYLPLFLFRIVKSGGEFFDGIPKQNILFSLLAVDGYVSVFKVPTFYIIGEWFLGFILIIYLIFPILRILVNKYPRITAIVLLGLYFVSVIFAGNDYELCARLPEFAFGMYFVKYIKKVPVPAAVVSLIVLIVNGILKPPFNAVYQISYVGIASFLLIVYLSQYLSQKPVRAFCTQICRYSYPCFIVHHYIIYVIAGRVDLESISIGKSYLLFLVCVVVISVASVALYWIHAILFNKKRKIQKR